jgi:hypothetical protein
MSEAPTTRRRMQFGTHELIVAIALLAISLTCGRASVWLYDARFRDFAGPAVMAAFVSFFMAAGVLTHRTTEGMIAGGVLGFICGRLCDSEFFN